MNDGIKDNGGPAFPVEVNYKITKPVRGDSDLVMMELGNYPGMSLRDWFAGMAMQADTPEEGEWTNNKARARWAYSMADALLAERAKEKTKGADHKAGA